MKFTLIIIALLMLVATGCSKEKRLLPGEWEEYSRTFYFENGNPSLITTDFEGTRISFTKDKMMSSSSVGRYKLSGNKITWSINNSINDIIYIIKSINRTTLQLENQSGNTTIVQDFTRID